MEMSVVMKRTVFLFALLLMVPGLAAAQTQTSTAVRQRVVGSNRANHVEKQKPNENSEQQAAKPSSTANQNSTQPKWGNTELVARPDLNVRTAPPETSTAARQKTTDQNVPPVKKLVQQTSMVAEAPRSLPVAANVTAPKPVAAPTALYHVGIGDVLDIRLTNLATRESTLYTVLKNGVLEYPLLNGAVSVAGLTTDEIATLLSNEIKVIKTARVSVSVRDYASHGVVVTGVVDSPGRKTMRREAMPLFAVLAEALPRPEASTATIVRDGKSQTVVLSNEPAMSTLILPGDVIKIAGRSSAAVRFVYVGGDVASRGEKDFREGMTLTQAILSAGGVSRGTRTTVRVARRDTQGFLKSSDYNLQSIEEGKSPDPLLEAGDRIEVTRGM